VSGIVRLAAACAGGVGVFAALVAAAPPSALSGVEGGLWEIDRGIGDTVRVCAPNPATLAQYEHRNRSCNRTVIRDSGDSATFSYTCPGAGFGQSTISVLTPRSLRVETQGISGNAPFNYVFQARRLGNCPAH
jgi:hypothetical protein